MEAAPTSQAPQPPKRAIERARRIPSFNDFCATAVDDAETLLDHGPPSRTSSGGGPAPRGAGRFSETFSDTFTRALEAHMRFD
ncbi:hypothetical protein Rsub_08421 [Raphidocelis subcapitata]|uniref:Uncharacterized protein n=1 Tax=Raphidocelis subcapitata TaxID=307507 RepID=A0A2V0P7C6_9CHLO|nr:hypothetical protein Rsub_08421 [Raphidocelis subcapitata]|eukprot:GBF95459.1 hypothetical protein Rsub_08421 [Raphidocelis subcapitata]